MPPVARFDSQRAIRDAKRLFRLVEHSAGITRVHETFGSDDDEDDSDGYDRYEN